jgi:hypothetical protein
MSRNRVAAVVAIAVVAGLGVPLLNLVVGLPGDVMLGDPGSGSAAFRKATAALALKCANCHSDQGEIPFYANFPIAKGMKGS